MILIEKYVFGRQMWAIAVVFFSHPPLLSLGKVGTRVRKLKHCAISNRISLLLPPPHEE